MLYEFSCLHDNEYELKVVLTLCTGHSKCWLFDQIESKAFSRGWNRPVLGTSICWRWYNTHCSGTVSTLTYTHLCYTHQLTIYCDNRCMNWVSIWIKHNTNEPEKQVNRLKITKWRSFVSVQCGIRWNWLSNLSIVSPPLINNVSSNWLDNIFLTFDRVLCFLHILCLFLLLFSPEWCYARLCSNIQPFPHCNYNYLLHINFCFVVIFT